MAIARITKNLMYIGVDAIKKFQSRLTALLKNKTLWLVQTRYETSNSQWECFFIKEYVLYSEIFNAILGLNIQKMDQVVEIYSPILYTGSCQGWSPVEIVA